MHRLHIYLSHSFDHADKYERVLEFARDEGMPVANFSVPVWRQIPGDLQAVRSAISERILRSNRVLVLVTDEIHKSPFIDFEVKVARELGKPIIGIFPNGANEGPIPQFLNGAYYRMVGWRRGALAKALLGEYPPDSRVFDIAELEERRKVLSLIGGTAGIVSFMVAGASALNFARLKQELTQRGIVIIDGKGPSLFRTVVPTTLGSALVGAAVMGACVGTPKAIAAGALLGGGIGAGIGLNKYYRVQINLLGALARMELRPIGV